MVMVMDRAFSLDSTSLILENGLRYPTGRFDLSKHSPYRGFSLPHVLLLFTIRVVMRWMPPTFTTVDTCYLPGRPPKDRTRDEMLNIQAGFYPPF